MTTNAETRPPVPPFTRETATQKVRMAEDGWNSRDPQRVSMVYTQDSQWRNRAEFPKGRAQIVEFLNKTYTQSLVRLSGSPKIVARLDSSLRWNDEIDNRALNNKKLLLT